tara:strand:+ start:9723 stop:10454 length:732 start_codon:yes stop_codon:yes gene_type:complete
MVKSNFEKDLIRNIKLLKNVGKKCLKSTTVLYATLLLAVLNLFVFITNKDNESLFLFLVISALSYMKTNNMIVVLLIPVVAVNLLILLRSVLANNKIEGMDSNELYNELDNVKSKAFLQWAALWYEENEQDVSEEISNINKSELSEDEKVNIKEFRKILKEYIKKDEGEVVLNQNEIDIILNFFKKMHRNKYDEIENLKKIAVDFVNEFPDEFPKKEGFTLLEGMEDEDEDEDEDEYEDEDDE